MTQPQDGRGEGTQHSPVPTEEMSGPSPQGPVDRGGWTALALGFAGVMLTFWFWPLGLMLGLALDAAAVTVGVRALRRARRQRSRAPGARGGLVLGGVGLALGIVLGSFTALFWEELQTYQRCMSGAITVEAREACDQQVREAIGERLGIPAEQLQLPS